MSLQVKNRKKKQFFRKNRKGVSIMIGYVLLVVFAIILSTITYQWIKTYIPSDTLECPDSGVSVSIRAVSYDCGNNRLSLTIRNNGRFSILGYFAHATNVSGQEVATIDLSQYFLENASSNGQKFGNSIAFLSGELNAFKPGDEEIAIFNLNSTIGQITSLQITPTRLQDIDNKDRFVSCGNEKVEQEIYCGMDTGIGGTTCIPDCAGKVCGGDGCGGVCGVGCSSNEFCDALGQCYSNTCTPDAAVCSGLACGFATNGTCGSISCGSCNAGIGEICSSGLCTLIGNGQCDTGETCLEEPVACEGQQAQCQVGEICQSGQCVFNAGGSFNSCGDYCALFGYSQTFACQDNPNKCVPPQGPVGGIYIGDVAGANETYGNSFCTGDPYCCCQI